MRSKLLEITIRNLGCIDNTGLTVALDNILCLVGDNNTGKSTVLHAYELAVETVRYDASKDRSKSSDNDTVIEISVHIPEGVENIAEKWKIIDGHYRIVKSRWTWDSHGGKIRETFDPEINDYSPDGKAGGLDNVFKSRLPKPFRIGALEGSDNEWKNLLKLIVDPISEKLKEKLEDKESEISKAILMFNQEAEKPVKEEALKIGKYNKDITKGHSSIFPNLSIDLSIGIGDFKFDPVDMLLKGSTLNVKEFGQFVDWNQQGTGSQRALFWSLLQVRSKIQAMKDYNVETLKKIALAEKDVSKYEKARDGAKTKGTKEKNQNLINEKLEEIKVLKERKFEADEENQLLLPGYMLLIDEPEIALHPNGIRAASKYLYDLSKDNSWQIMLTTHSPLFVNPFEDNTTIVRLSRNEGSPSPKTYKSETISFSEDEKQQLTLLNTFDQNLAEMFFGQYPIIVEGDTEFASFQKVMSLENDKYPLSSRPLIVKARGKYTIIPIIKMLNHFKIDFSVLHDSDYPKTKKGTSNSAWTGNDKIAKEIKICRDNTLNVIHRISFSTFEIEHIGIEVKEDGNVKLPKNQSKPFEMYKLIGEDNTLKEGVEKILDELIDVKSNQEPFEKKTAFEIDEVFKGWVAQKKIKDFKFVV